jgi:hypothetical protein
MAQTQSSAELAASCLIFIVSLFDLCVGISEAIFLSKYSQFDDECRQIWAWILVGCIVNFIIPIFAICAKIFQDYRTILQFARIGYYVVGIWSLVTYYNINNSCYSFWTSSAPELWTFVLIHFVLMWINIAAIIIGTCLYCCTGTDSASGTALKRPTANVVGANAV